jgi:dolichol-phosphate mannosyltransferase
MLAGGWAVAKRLVWGQPLFTDPFFPIAIFFGLAGIQLLFFGLLAELSMRTYFESARKPPYLVRETVNLPPPRGDG